MWPGFHLSEMGDGLLYFTLLYFCRIALVAFIRLAKMVLPPLTCRCGGRTLASVMRTNWAHAAADHYSIGHRNPSYHDLFALDFCMRLNPLSISEIVSHHSSAIGLSF